MNQNREPAEQTEIAQMIADLNLQAKQMRQKLQEACQKFDNPDSLYNGMIEHLRNELTDPRQDTIEKKFDNLVRDINVLRKRVLGT